MSRPIQSNPLGLLGLLALKNTGQNPPVMVDEITPVLETMPFYMAGNTQWSGAFGQTVPVGSFPLQQLALGLGPPDSIAWLVSGGEVTLFLPATATMGGFILGANVALVSNPAFHYALVDTLQVSTVGASPLDREWTFALPRDLMLLPGEQLMPLVAIDNLLVADVQIRAQVRYTPIPI